MRFLRRFSRLRSGLWFIPLMCVLAGVALSFGTIAIDRAFDYQLVPQSISGGPDAAIEILGTVAASMVSLAALVLTITMVVVQLAMGQFSPRIVQRILQDKPSQLAIGIFVGTFAHAMLALREVQTDGDGAVPGRRSGGCLRARRHQHHGAGLVRQPYRALTQSVCTDRACRQRHAQVARPDLCGPWRDTSDGSTILAPHSGVITRIDHDALVRIAAAADCVLTLRPALGEFVPAGAPLFEIAGALQRLDVEAAVNARRASARAHP